jgi:hypothetical protein
MMRMRLSGSVTALILGLAVTVAWACPEQGTATKAKGGCGGKKVITVADKSPCGADCTKDCCKKGSKTVADSGAVPPCHGKSGKTVADKTKSGCGKPCLGKGALTGTREGCPIAKKVKAVLASMPAIKYRVDGDEVCCPECAKALAEKTGKPIEYLVGEEVLTDKVEATARLAAVLDKEAETLQAMQFVAGGKCYGCPVTAKSVAKKTKGTIAYRVGGVDFEKKEYAEKALASIREALAGVKMQYKVGDKTYGCSKMAGAKCKEAGKKMTYMVGTKETCCDKAAKLLLAEARVRTIVETAVQTSFSL